MIAQEDTHFYYEFGLRQVRYFILKNLHIYRHRSDSVMHSHNAKRAIEYYYSMMEMYRVYMKYYTSIYL